MRRPPSKSTAHWPRPPPGWSPPPAAAPGGRRRARALRERCARRTSSSAASGRSTLVRLRASTWIGLESAVASATIARAGCRCGHRPLAAAVGGLGGDDGRAAEECEHEMERAVAAVERGVLEEERREGGGAVDGAAGTAASPWSGRRPLAHRPSRDEHDEFLGAAEPPSPGAESGRPSVRSTRTWIRGRHHFCATSSTAAAPVQQVGRELGGDPPRRRRRRRRHRAAIRVDRQQRRASCQWRPSTGGPTISSGARCAPRPRRCSSRRR